MQKAVELGWEEQIRQRQQVLNMYMLMYVLSTSAHRFSSLVDLISHLQTVSASREEPSSELHYYLLRPQAFQLILILENIFPQLAILSSAHLSNLDDVPCDNCFLLLI